MPGLRLEERLDAVLVFDAISHMSTEAESPAATRTARAHPDAGGMARFCPGWTAVTFAPTAIAGWK